MLIPPSALAVLLGTIAEIDIGKLLIAGIVPGLILATYPYSSSARDPRPEAAPAYNWRKPIGRSGFDCSPLMSS